MPENGVLSLRPKSHDIKLQTDAETKLREFLCAVADFTAGSQPKIRHGDGWRRSWGPNGLKTRYGGRYAGRQDAGKRNRRAGINQCRNLTSAFAARSGRPADTRLLRNR